MKLKKKSGLIGAIVALSCASMISVGFASWVISQGSEEVAQGTIVVDNVSTKTYQISYASGVTEGDPNVINEKIVFGNGGWISVDGQTDHHWLTNDGKLNGVAGDSSADHLTASFTFSISNIDGASATSDANVMSLTNGGESVYYNVTAALSSDNYKQKADEQTHANLLGELPTPVLSYNAGVFTCSVTFSWGEYFKIGETQVNPYTYFNAKENNSTNVAEANTILTELAGLGATYNITLTVANA